MLKTLLSTVLVFAFFWFFPDIYLWTRNASNALFQEAANIDTLRVEIKVAKPVAFLPLRYGVLGKGEKAYYVELYSEKQRKVIGQDTSEGSALLEGVIADQYEVRVALLREFADIDMRRYQQYGESMLVPDELLKTSLSSLTIENDVFAVAVLLPEENI